MTLRVRIRHALPDFTLDVAFEASGVTALFGRSGAGKTTVVNAVAGLVRPDDCDIALDGRVLANARTWLPPHRRNIGYVFQDARLFPHMTVRANLRYARRDAPFARIVEMLGIGHLLGRRPATLSGGERQRVAIGRALMAAPDLLFMDEPLSALDEARRAEILPYLERLCAEGGLPILYVSHSVAEVARLASTVVLMDRGRVTGIGAPSALLADPLHAAALGRDAGAMLEGRVTALATDGLAQVETQGGTLHLDTRAEVGTRLRIRIHAQDVMIARTRPEALSALNILSAKVADITPEGHQALVGLDCNGARILARITLRSVAALGLDAGAPCHAILKTVAIADQSSSSGGTVSGSVGETTGRFSALSR